MPGSVAESKVVKEVKHQQKKSSRNCFKLAAGFKNKKNMLRNHSKRDRFGGISCGQVKRFTPAFHNETDSLTVVKVFAVSLVLAGKHVANFSKTKNCF